MAGYRSRRCLNGRELALQLMKREVEMRRNLSRRAGLVEQLDRRLNMIQCIRQHLPALGLAAHVLRACC